MIRLSPLEERTLELVGQQWHTEEELKRKLFPEHPPTSVKSALDYLRRRELVYPIPRQHGQPYYDITPYGQQLLADHQQARRPLYLEGARV